MARAPSSTLHTAFVRCVALLLLVPISAVALVPYPSNMDALVATVEDAIDESLAGLEMSSETGDAPVFIAPQGRHDANWLVEHVLAQRLLERGFTIVSDSTQVGQESMRFSFASSIWGLPHSPVCAGQRPTVRLVQRWRCA